MEKHFRKSIFVCIMIKEIDQNYPGRIQQILTVIYEGTIRIR